MKGKTWGVGPRIKIPLIKKPAKRAIAVCLILVQMIRLTPASQALSLCLARSWAHAPGFTPTSASGTLRECVQSLGSSIDASEVTKLSGSIGLAT